MNCQETLYKFQLNSTLTPKKAQKQKAAAFAAANGLLLAEGLAVGALIDSGVTFVGAHQDAVQGAVILGVAVVSALLDGAFDTLVCIAVHGLFLLLLDYGFIMCLRGKYIQAVEIFHKIWYCGKRENCY